MIVKLFILAVLVAALLVIGTLLAATVTGREGRAYRSLPPGDTVEVAGAPVEVSQLASRYMPRFHLRPSTPSPPLLWVWYDAVPRAGAVDLIYYLNWESEVNPNASVNSLYSIFRAAYYGYPLYDIEYFQIGIDLRTGRIARVRFETSESDDYFQAVPPHITVEIDCRPSLVCTETRTRRSGEIIARDGAVGLPMDGNSLLVGVQTWNHLSVLLDANRRSQGYRAIQPRSPSPRYLSMLDYKRYKFSRKSQGDHRTQASLFSRVASVLAVSIFVSFPLWMVRRRSVHRKERS